MKRIAQVAAAAAIVLIAALPAHGQDSTKPGGLKKVATNVSKTMKKAGQDTKAEVKRDASKAHGSLQNAGNETKTVLKKTTGIKGSTNPHPGGLNKVAHDISNTSKRAASDTKAEVRRDKAKVHAKLTETGKSIKDTTLKGKP